jgi:hypothetical protein
MFVMADDSAQAALVTGSATVIAAIVTGVIALIVAVISAIVTGRNRKKTNQNASDLERLKAGLSHRQNVRKAQWDIEFGAYQAIWKAIVPVRDWAGQLVTYEESLQKLNIAADIGDVAMVEGIKDRAKELDEALQEFARQVHNNAVFYPPDIRQKAVVVINELGSFTMAMVGWLIAQKKGELWGNERLTEWRALRNKELVAGFTAIESVDAAIRERLSSVHLVG